MANSLKSAMFLSHARIQSAALCSSSFYDLGLAYSVGTDGLGVDLIEAHKFLNIAAMAGSAEAHSLRADISDEMTAREIVEAQKRARSWLAARQRLAA